MWRHDRVVGAIPGTKVVYQNVEAIEAHFRTHDIPLLFRAETIGHYRHRRVTREAARLKVACPFLTACLPHAHPFLKTVLLLTQQLLTRH